MTDADIHYQDMKRRSHI